jgi:PAS domain S-box-containing protein
MKAKLSGTSLRSRIFSSFLAALLPVLLLAVVGIETLLVPYVESGIWETLSTSTKLLADSVKASASVAIRNHLKAMAEKNREIARQYFKLARQGVLTQQAVKDRLRTILLSQSVGTSGYIYCINSQGIAVVHPNPGVENTDNTRFAFVREQMARKEGYIEYEWQNPGEPAPRSKALYMVYFEPLDWIISVSSYREEFSTLIEPDDFRESVLSLKFGKSGYAYAFNKEGVGIIHPVLKGVNLLKQSDFPADFMREMLAKNSGTLVYMWKNPHETEARRKLAVYDTISELGWTIASSAYWDEVMQPVLIARAIGYGAIVMLLLMAGFVSYLLSGRLAMPIGGMIRQLDRNARQGRHDPLPVDQSSVELGRLGQEFNDFLSTIEEQNTALRNQRARYRSLFEASPDAILLIRGLEIIDCNPTAFEVFNGDAGSLIGRTILELSPPLQPDGQEMERSAWRLIDAASKTSMQTFEWSHITLNGRLFDAEVRLKPFGAQGGEGLTVAFVRDITEKKKAEAELAATRRMLETAIAQSPLGIMIAEGSEVAVTLANSAALGGQGRNSKELIRIEPGRKPFDWKIHHLSGAPYTFEELPLTRAVLQGQETYNQELLIRWKSGDERLVLANAAPIRDQKGEVAAGILIMHDITRLKRAEQERLANEKRLNAILEASPDPVIVYDQEGQASYVNPAFTRVFGWEAFEVLGRRIPFVPEGQRKISEETIKRLYGQGGTVSLETKRLTKSGDAIDVMVSAAGIPDDQGEIIGMVVNLTDLSETKRLEAQLRQSQKMEAIGTLAGGIAHDFNNILSAILGAGELAQIKANSGRDYAVHIGQVVRSAERARDLVKQLLTFSRQSEIELKPIHINELVIQSMAMLERTIPKMIKMELHLAEDLEPIKADATQLEQVLINLAGNAADAMPEGGTLAIETRLAKLSNQLAEKHGGLATGNYVQVSIRDTGHGMDQDTVSQIFDPFFTTKEIGKGTGLGLSTAYGIVKEHQGHISCSSQPGRGATFLVYLPAHPDGLPSPQVKDQASVSAPGGNEAILLVDDEKVIRELGSEMLQGVGYRVLTAGSGEEALALMKEPNRHIDLMILDLGMPGMGGLRCLKELAAMDPDFKVLVASGYSPDRRIQDTLEDGAAGFIAKPFRHTDLLSTVREVLDS